MSEYDDARVREVVEAARAVLMAEVGSMLRLKRALDALDDVTPEELRAWLADNGCYEVHVDYGAKWAYGVVRAAHSLGVSRPNAGQIRSTNRRKA